MSKLRAEEWLLSQNKFVKASDKKIKNQPAMTISVTSGKGGVGKTSISALLGKKLADKGFKVLLVDCDYNLSNLGIKFGLPIVNDASSWLESASSLDEVVTKQGKLHLLPACNGHMDLYDNPVHLDSVVIQILVAAERRYDFVITDCAAGINKDSLTINAYSDRRLVVVTPDKSSITDSYSLMKILKKKFGVSENDLVLNKVRNEAQASKITRSLQETAYNFIDSRLVPMGHVEHFSGAVQDFDSMMWNEENSSFNDSVAKLVDAYSDRLTGRRFIHGELDMDPLDVHGPKLSSNETGNRMLSNR